MAVDPNASSQRRRKEQNHRFLTKNHQSAQNPVVKTQIASNTFFCLKLQRDLMEFDGIYNGNLGIYNGILRRAGEFTTGFLSSQNAETSVAAEPFEMADVAKIQTPL